MTTKRFREIIKRSMEETEIFVTDTIDMKDIRNTAKKMGMDDAILVAGDSEKEVFIVYIQKI